MGFTELRWSERIRNRNNPMLPQMKREETRVPISFRHKSKNNIQRHKRHTSPFSKLPDVLVVEILSRLPPKPFFCCRSVCKTWLFLSSDVVRLNKHLQPTTCIFFYNHAYGVGFENLSCGINKVEVDGTISALSLHNNVKILDCCNGLLLVKAYKKRSCTHDVHVYIPAIWTLFTLAFDSQVFLQLHDQVFSSAFNLQVFHNGSNGKVNFIDFFSYEKGKYKRHKKLVSDVKIKCYSRGTFVDKRVNRLTTQDEILSVDSNNYSYQVIRSPNLENRTVIEIGQSQGVLHCISICCEKMLFIWIIES